MEEKDFRIHHLEHENATLKTSVSRLLSKIKLNLLQAADGYKGPEGTEMVNKIILEWMIMLLMLMSLLTFTFFSSCCPYLYSCCHLSSRSLPTPKLPKPRWYLESLRTSVITSPPASPPVKQVVITSSTLLSPRTLTPPPSTLIH